MFFPCRGFRVTVDVQPGDTASTSATSVPTKSVPKWVHPPKGFIKICGTLRPSETQSTQLGNKNPCLGFRRSHPLQIPPQVPQENAQSREVSPFTPLGWFLVLVLNVLAPQ